MLAKEAAIKAKDFLLELLGNEVGGIRLEEVELDTKEGFWYITLSYYLKSQDPLETLTGGIHKRFYRKFKIKNDDNGIVVDMKIRELEHAE